jgi:hypothetical protein
MYVATDVGIFATSDSGNSWEPLVDGLPRAVVTGVKLIRGSRILRASTYGRGVWDLQLPPAQSTPVPDFALTISPQNVTLSRGSSSPLRVSIQSLNGFTGNVKLACTVPSSLASVTCIVAPDTIAGGGTATVTITSSGQTATVNRSLGTTTALALIPFACVFLLRFDKRLRCANKRNTALFAIVLAVAIGSIALGCGGTRNASTPPAGGAAPPSTASPITGTIVIQGTTGTQTHAINVSLTIT